MEEQYQAQFESFGTQAPGMGQAIQADLGIDRVSAEFDRQNKGAERVQEQIEKNQKVLIEGAKTDSINAQTKIKDMQALAKFSQTAAKAVVDYQKNINEKKVTTGLMDAFLYGLPEEQMQQFDNEEAALNGAQVETEKMAGEYQREGGMPAVVSALRNQNNHYAYGYAKGLLMQAGMDYPAYLAMKRKNFSMRMDGQDVTLATASAAQRPVIMRALNEMYVSQFAGLNPAMVNKYLFEPMRKGMNADTIQWNKDWAEREKAEMTSTRRKALATGLQGTDPVGQLVLQLNELQAYLGSGALARQQIAEDLKYLREGGIISPEQEANILNQEFEDRNKQKRRLIDWPEFAKAEQAAEDASVERRQQAIQRENLRKEEAKSLWSQQMPEIQAMNLRGAQRYKFAREWAQKQGLTMQDTQYLMNWVNRNPEAVQQREKELLQQIAMGRDIYPEMLGGFDELRQNDAIASALTKTEGAAEGDFAGADAILTSAVVKASQSENAEGLQAKPMATQTLVNAKEEVRKQYRKNLGVYKDPEKAMAMAIQTVKDMITPFDSTVKEDGKLNNLEQSPLSPANYLQLDPKEAEFVSIGQAQREIQQRATSGVDPFADVLGGTDRYLKEMEKNVQAGKEDPIPAFYEVLARGQPYSKWHIANAQRIANGQDPLPVPPEIAKMQELPPSAQRLLERTPYVQDKTIKRAAYQTDLAEKGNPYSELLGLLRAGEGDYTSANRGYAGDTPGGVPSLDKKTLGEWKRLQRSGYNALGAYQFIPGTLRQAAANLGLSDDTIMTPAVQDQLAIQLIMGGQKRPRLTAYLSGKTQDIDGALDALALEWASVATASGGTAYPGVGGNAASIPRESARSILIRLREYNLSSPYNQNENLKPGLRR